MKILFIYPNPSNGSHSSSNKLLKIFFNYPLSTFEALANVTPKEHSIEVIDERFEEIDFEEN